MQSLRVLQWNILAKKLALPNWFPMTDPQHLKWDYRKTQIIAQLQTIQADLLCLQEVDEYPFFCDVLSNYGSTFASKYPLHSKSRSKLLDGSAIFYRKDRFRMLKSSHFRYSEDQAQTALFAKFECLRSKKCFYVATTHLKSGSGDENEEIRQKQVQILLKYLTLYTQEDPTAPVLICGDLNAKLGSNVHTEFGTYSSIWNQSQLSNVYTVNVGNAEGGAFREVLDYIYFSPQSLSLHKLSINLPNESLPNDLHPSDHLPIVATFGLI